MVAAKRLAASRDSNATSGRGENHATFGSNDARKEEKEVKGKSAFGGLDAIEDGDDANDFID